jgi:hypothetical protein
VTFKDLQKVIQSETNSYTLTPPLFQKLQGKPFWIWDLENHRQADKDRGHKGTCCFNHIIGLPRKDGIEKPMFDYERILYKALVDPKYLNTNPAIPQDNSRTHKQHFTPFQSKALMGKKGYRPRNQSLC